MERFFNPNLLGDPDCSKRQYATYKADPEWQRIYSFLHPGYWHGTNHNAWADILKCGAIRPNIGGQYSTRWGKRLMDRSYAYANKCVPLFDFASPSEKEVIREWGNAWEVLTDQEVSTVLLRLDRCRLHSKIIPNSRAYPKAANGKIYGLIPFCEVWYPEDIPTNIITAAFRILPPSEFGELNWEEISKTAIVQPVYCPKVVEFFCWQDMTEKQAFQYVLTHPGGPFPPELIARFPKLFGNDRD